MDETTRAMYELVRRVRHDLNSPLTSALGNVQMLLEDPAVETDDTREVLREIEADLRRLASLVQQLSDVRPPSQSRPSSDDPA